MNQSAIDRGLFRSVFYRCYTAEENREAIGGHDVAEVIETPDSSECILRLANYALLEEDGLIAPGSHVTGEGT